MKLNVVIVEIRFYYYECFNIVFFNDNFKFVMIYIIFVIKFYGYQEFFFVIEIIKVCYFENLLIVFVYFRWLLWLSFVRIVKYQFYCDFNVYFLWLYMYLVIKVDYFVIIQY